MFIIEYIVDLWKKRKQDELPEDENTSDIENQLYPLENTETCEHVFMPVDSTGEILSCTKCGLVKRREELKNKNFFMK